MSLCRWSHSPFYIYEECGAPDDEIKVSWFGSFKSKDIVSNWYNNVYLRSRTIEGYGILESLELVVWLYPWALYTENKISVKNYHRILEFTRFLSYVRTYVTTLNSDYFNYSLAYVDDIIQKFSFNIIGEEVPKPSKEEIQAWLKEFRERKT